MPSSSRTVDLAAEVAYDPSASGMAADDVQAALDELWMTVDAGGSVDESNLVHKTGAETIAGLKTFIATTAATTGLVVKGASGQTANLQEWQDSAGAVLAGLNAACTRFATPTRFALGSNLGVPGADYQINVGHDNVLTSTTPGCTVVGRANSAGDDVYTNIFGNGNQLSGIGTRAPIVLGLSNTVSGAQPFFVGGKNNTVSGVGGGVLGDTCEVSGLRSVAIGTIGVVAEAGVLGFATYDQAPSFRMQMRTSTSNARDLSSASASWVDSTDATRTARVTLSACDWIGPREGLRIEADGTRALSAVGGPVTANTTLTVHAGAAAATPLLVKGAASQTASLQEWQNSGGAAQATVSPLGAFVARSFATWNAMVLGDYYILRGSPGTGARVELGAGAEYSVTLKANTSATSSGGALVTNAVASVKPLVVRGAASQTAPLVVLQGLSSTSAVVDMAYVDAAWADATHATRKGRLVLSALDANGTREGLRLEADGTAARIGFLGAAAVARPTGDLAAALVALGLVASPTTTVPYRFGAAGVITTGAKAPLHRARAAGVATRIDLTLSAGTATAAVEVSTDGGATWPVVAGSVALAAGSSATATLATAIPADALLRVNYTAAAAAADPVVSLYVAESP